MKVIVAWSGGKDSTAMLLHMMELGEQIDEVVFADPGYEYSDLYEYLQRVAKQFNVTFRTIRAPENALVGFASGKVTRGEHEGEIRGFPLALSACWFMRDHKKAPIDRLREGDSVVCLGYAYDEENRWEGILPGIRCPLVEWKWTEADCVRYLNEKGILNPLYVNFNRTGCFFCPKMGVGALYATWKAYPAEWRRACDLDEKSIAISGRPIRIDGTYAEWQQRFEKGYVPPQMPKYSCWSGCEGVKRAFKQEQQDLCAFDMSKH